MRLLFVVGHAQETETVFRLADEMARDGGRIVFLFIGDGCRHAADPELMRTLRFAEGIYALEADCRSRGLQDRLVEGVEATDYDGWVDLLEACDRVVSWA